MLEVVRPKGSVTEHRMRDGRIKYRVRITARRKRPSLGLHDTIEEAERILRAALDELPDDMRETLRTWGTRWLDAREVDTIHRSVSRERSVWRKHVLVAPFADWPLEQIGRADVVRWVKERMATGLARSTVHSALSLLRGALHDAADEELVPHNPAADVKTPKRARDHDGWDWIRPPEIDAVLAMKMRADQRAIFTVAIYSGLRAGELWGLRWRDVVLEGDRPELHVCRSYRRPTKGGQTRHVPLLPEAVAALRAWRDIKPGIGEALVFPADPHPRGKTIQSRRGGGCHHSGYDAGWPDVWRRAGFPRRMRFHDLRHTCGSHLVMGTWTGGPRGALRLEDVRMWLGHSTISVTERYAHLAPDYLHRARDTARTPDTAAKEKDQ